MKDIKKLLFAILLCLFGILYQVSDGDFFPVLIGILAVGMGAFVILAGDKDKS